MATILPVTLTDLRETALTLYGECRGEPLQGQIAVAWVIRIRATWDEVLQPGHPEHEWWGTTPATACKHPYQFSCRNPGTPSEAMLEDLPQTVGMYQFLYGVARDVFSGHFDDPTHGATTYKVTGTKASWDAAVFGHDPCIIGHHSFWRLSPHGQVLPWLS